MSRTYALTCSCGQTHLVEARHAGTTVHCPCGEVLQVPSLRELSALEPVDAQRPRPRLMAVWGRHQALLAVGAIVTVSALLGAAYLQNNKPRLLDIERLSPPQTWALWQELRRGPDRRLSPGQQQFLQRLQDNRFRLRLMFVLAGIGTVVMLAALCVPKQWSRGSPRELRRSAIPP